MDWMLILTAIGTAATLISTVQAISARNEARKILAQIREENSRNIEGRMDVRVSNRGDNSGVISGVNSGDIQK